jgi:hypothetical protein
MLPKAEVPTKPLRERFDSPVTEASVPSAEVNWKPVRVMLTEVPPHMSVPQPCLPQPVATASYRLV